MTATTQRPTACKDPDGHRKDWLETENGAICTLCGAPAEPGAIGEQVANSNGHAPPSGQPEEEVVPSSWAPVDLDPSLDGPEGIEQPTILRRTDGEGLIYPGRSHSICGESESCKSLIAQYAAVEQLGAGHHVAVVDFETEPHEWVDRLLALGAGAESIRAQLHYVRPDEPIDDGGWAALASVLASKPTLVIWDGVTEAMTMHGLNPLDNRDVATWQRIPKRAIRETGCASVEVDHVVKDKDSRGRYSIGAQHKLAGVYVLYTVEIVEPFGRGCTGEVRVKVQKDRPGFIRRYADGKDVATIHFISDGKDRIEVAIEPPAPSVTSSRNFRPTTLMERVSEALELEPGMSVTKVREAVEGNSRAKDTALRLLVAEGYVRVEQDGQAKRHFTARLYRAAEDPKAPTDA